MALREAAVKKYVVRVSAEERERLEDLRSKGTIPARRLLKVQILLKADVSEGWSDSKIMEAFYTTYTMFYTVRKKLVVDGLDAVLSRKRRETPPVARIVTVHIPPPFKRRRLRGLWAGRGWLGLRR